MYLWNDKLMLLVSFIALPAKNIADVTADEVENTRELGAGKSFSPLGALPPQLNDGTR